MGPMAATSDRSDDGEDGAPEAAGVPGVPDVRFTFANERTFLAWIRTALALVAGGLAATQLLPPFEGVPGGRRLLGFPLLALGAAVAWRSYGRWAENEAAIRSGRPLASTRLLAVVAGMVAGVAVVGAVLLVVAG